MGINVQLEDERGTCLEMLEDYLPGSLKLHNLVFYGRSDFPLVGSIHPYGDTIFNRLQMRQLLKEWAVLISRVQESERIVMEETRRLAEACRDGVHLYLRFIGD